MLAVPAATPPQWDLIGYACIEIYGQDNQTLRSPPPFWTLFLEPTVCAISNLSDSLGWRHGSMEVSLLCDFALILLQENAFFAVQSHTIDLGNSWNHFLLSELPRSFETAQRGARSQHTGDQMIKMELWPETQKPQVSGRTFVEPRSQSPMFCFFSQDDLWAVMNS